MSTERIAYSYESAADQIEVSVGTIKQAIAAGDLTARKIGKLVRIEHQELLDWFRARPTK